MADYIFNVILNTDKVELKSEYVYDLPSFYFVRNEFVRPRVQSNIINSILSCRGANIDYGEGALTAKSSEFSSISKTTMYTPIILVQAETVVYANPSVITSLIVNIIFGSYATIAAVVI